MAGIRATPTANSRYRRPDNRPAERLLRGLGFRTRAPGDGLLELELAV